MSKKMKASPAVLDLMPPLPLVRDGYEDPGSTVESCADWLRRMNALAITEGQFSRAVIARPAFFDAICAQEFQPIGSNRPIRPRKVAQHLATMRAGRWVSIHPSGVWFCDDGRLAEGGHRTRAGQKARQTLVLWMTFGASNAARLAEGQEQAPRNPGDTFAIAGINMVSRAATAATVRILLEIAGGTWTLDDRLGARSLEALEFYLEHEHQVQAAVRLGRRAHDGFDVSCSQAALAAAMFDILRTHPTDDVMEAFLDGLASNGVARNHPLKECSVAFRKGRIGRGASQKQEVAIHQYAAIVNAWNLWRARRTIHGATALMWEGPGSPLPVVRP